MLNLFQHLIKSLGYETLKRVQGDKKRITTQSLMGEGGGGGDRLEYFPLTPACRQAGYPSPAKGEGSPNDSEILLRGRDGRYSNLD
jgi:hypothetical protein